MVKIQFSSINLKICAAPNWLFPSLLAAFGVCRILIQGSFFLPELLNLSLWQLSFLIETFEFIFFKGVCQSLKKFETKLGEKFSGLRNLQF